MKVQDDEYIFPISNLFRKEQSHQIYKRIIDLVGHVNVHCSRQIHIALKVHSSRSQKTQNKVILGAM